jgi:integrase
VKTKRPKLPTYRKQTDKTGARAFVEVNRRRIYLGRYGSTESKQAYARIVAELAVTGGAPPVEPSEITIAEVADRWLVHLSEYYVSGSREPAQHTLALKPLLELYADEKAVTFGPLALKAVRQRMVDRGWARAHVNKNTRRIQRMFRWAAGEQLIPLDVWHLLKSVEGLRFGHTAAPETEPVRPVAENVIDQTVKHCTPTLAAMIRLQQYTGMRPGELCILRSGDVDVTGKVWVYAPERHKTQHHGRERKVFIGPKAQAVLRPYLKADLQAYVFSPAQAERERLEQRHAARKTPPNQGNRPGTNRKAKPRRKPGTVFNTQSYGRAIKNACRRAWPAPKELTEAKVRQWHAEHLWTANRLRHSFATQVRRDHGVDLAGALLGHASASTVTAVYAERDMQQAAAVALRIG